MPVSASLLFEEKEENRRFTTLSLVWREEGERVVSKKEKKVSRKIEKFLLIYVYIYHVLARCRLPMLPTTLSSPASKFCVNINSVSVSSCGHNPGAMTPLTSQRDPYSGCRSITAAHIYYFACL